MTDNVQSPTAESTEQEKKPSRRNPTVVVDNVSVVYNSENSDTADRGEVSLKQRVASRLLGRPTQSPVTAIDSITFAAYEGDSIGLIGPNGAGKSTLLRIIAGAESPAGGTVWASSQPVLQGVSAALLPQLPGIENARLGCLAMGMTREEAAAAIPDIVEFSALGKAIYRPMNTYSSGMAARLRFAISTAIRPEILLVDEALSTGDASFQEKSRERMNAMLDGAGTIFLVSHSLATIRELCNRSLWLNDGKIIAEGHPDKIAPLYVKWARFSVKGDQKNMNNVANAANRDFPPEIIKIKN